MVVENRHGVVALTADGVVYGGGAYDGVVSTDVVHDVNGIWRAYAVGVMEPGAREVLLIGLGSGSWARVLAALPGVERLTILEINPGYLEIIRSSPQVASILTDPRVEIVIDDARRWLARHADRRFDAVVSNVTLHWRASSTNLLSREFAELVRSRLRPGGLYFFNTTYFVPARDTALHVFGHGFHLGTFFAASDEPFAYDGVRLGGLLRTLRLDGEPVLDPARADDRAALARLEALVPRVYGRADAGPRIVTDDNMLPEWFGYRFDVSAHGRVTP
jgi:hypothetical protein